MSERRQVLLVSPHCWPLLVFRNEPLGRYSQGGQTVVMAEIASWLASRHPDWDIEIWSSGLERESVQVAPNLNLLVEPLRFDRVLLKEEMTEADLEDFTSRMLGRTRLRFDRRTLVNGHYWDGWVVAQKLKARFGCRFVGVTHSVGRIKQYVLNSFTVPPASERAYLERRIEMEGRALSAVDCLLYYGAIEHNFLTRFYAIPPEKLVRVLNGISDQYFSPAKDDRPVEQPSFQENDRQVRFFTVGRADPFKGLLDTLLFLRQATSRIEDLSCRVQVAGSENDFVRKTLEEFQGLGFSVESLGPIPPQEMLRHYRESDFTLLLSMYDTCPLVLIEALSQGSIPVTHRKSGLSDLLLSEGIGVVVDPYSATDIEKMVRLLASHEERRAFARRIREWWTANGARFRWDSVVDSYEKCFEAQWKTAGSGLPEEAAVAAPQGERG